MNLRKDHYRFRFRWDAIVSSSLTRLMIFHSCKTQSKSVSLERSLARDHSGLAAGVLEHTKCRARSDLSLPCFSGYLTLHSGPRWRLETTRLALSEVSPGSKVPRVARSAPIDVGSVGRPPRTWFEIASGYGYLASLTLNAHSCLLSISISIWMRECCVVVLRRELRCQATARFKEQPLPYGCRPPDVFGLFFLFFLFANFFDQIILV